MVTAASKQLDDVRSHLLAAGPKSTMSKLYNEVTDLEVWRDVRARAFALLLAHERLNDAVADAYGWKWPLSDKEILRRMLELNLLRSDKASIGGVTEIEEQALV